MARKRFFNRSIKGLKSLFRKSKSALVTGIAVSGGIIISNSVIEVLPEFASFTYQLVLGVGLVLLAGYLSGLKIKR